MAEAMKVKDVLVEVPSPFPTSRRVLHLAVRDSVELHGCAPQTTFTERRNENRPSIGGTPNLTMDFDRGLGGICIRYEHRGEAMTYLVPLSNVRAVRLET